MACLGMYGINGQLLKAVRSLYEKSEACVSLERRVNGLR